MKTILIFTTCILLFIVSNAQPGTSDKSFGDTGIVLNKNITGALNKIALQSDGKIIGAGGGTANQAIPFLIIRYNTDGSIDSSFGTGGVTGNYNELSQVFGLAIQQDDAVIALGHTASDIKLAKYKKDGDLDSSFGSNGTVITNVGQNDIPVDVIIQPDGKIVAGGYIINQPNEARQGFLIQYLPDGSLDKSFGNNGIAILGEVNGDKSFGNVYAIALQPSGRILMSANFNGGVVYRFDADGSIDSSFGNKGKAIFQQSDDVVKSFIANSLVTQPDGKIAGSASSLKKQFSTDFTYMAMARLNADGSIDRSFGNNGLQHVEFGKGPSEGTSILLQNDGKLIVAGRTYDDNQTYSYLALTRLNSNGKTDSAFGDNGQTVTEMEGYAGAAGALLQKDGKIVLGGDKFIGGFGGNSYCLLARYNNDESNKQIIIIKIRHWLQHHNGIEWNNVNRVSSYVVQRSYDGIHFNSIARISSQSNSTYEDQTPLNGNNYYRLQTTSINGALNYSNVIAVTNDDIKISSNPATNSLHTEGLPSQKTKLTVVDFAGNIKLQAVANASSYNLNITSLKQGNYLLKIDMNGDVVTKQFVKE